MTSIFTHTTIIMLVFFLDFLLLHTIRLLLCSFCKHRVLREGRHRIRFWNPSVSSLVLFLPRMSPMSLGLFSTYYSITPRAPCREPPLDCCCSCRVFKQLPFRGSKAAPSFDPALVITLARYHGFHVTMQRRLSIERFRRCFSPLRLHNAAAVFSL
jgi:hypothetical protein